MRKRKKVAPKPSKTLSAQVGTVEPVKLPSIEYRPKPNTGESRWSWVAEDGDRYNYDCVKDMADSWAFTEERHLPVIVALYLKAHGVPKLPRKR